MSDSKEIDPSKLSRTENEFGVVLQKGSHKVGYTYDGFIDFGLGEAFSLEDMEELLPMIQVLTEELREVVETK